MLYIAQYMAKALCTRNNMMKRALYDNLVHFPKSSYITWLTINFVKGQGVTYIYLIYKSIMWWSFIVKFQSVVIKIFKSMHDYHISIHKIIQLLAYMSYFLEVKLRYSSHKHCILVYCTCTNINFKDVTYPAFLWQDHQPLVFTDFVSIP